MNIEEPRLQNSRQSCCGTLWDLWNHHFMRQIRTCLYFFSTEVALVLIDLGTDLALGINYFQNGNIIWGSLTISLMFLPFFSTLSVSTFKWIWYKTYPICKKEIEKSEFTFGLDHLPFIQGFRNAYIFSALLTIDTTDQHNSSLIYETKSKSSNISTKEALLESTPQFILQTYIVLTTGTIGASQLICIIFSFLSIWSTSLRLFFTARIGKEKEDRPNWRFILVLAPLAFMDLLGSVALIVSLVILSKGIGLIFAIGIIIPANLFLHKVKKFSVEIKEKIENRRQIGIATDVENCVKNIPTLLQLSAYTSWIINTVIVKSNTKLQPYSSFITLLTYSILITDAIIYQVVIERNTIQDFSFLICAPKNLTFIEPKSNNLLNFVNSSSVMDTLPKISTKLAVRVCNKDEHPFDILLKAIVPVLCVSLVVKSVAVVGLSILSDCRRLIKFVRCLG